MPRYASDAHKIIVQELERFTKSSLATKKRLAIPCPFHKETQPSLYINLDPTNRKTAIGGYYCFGCRAKSSTNGGWNGLAKELGLAEINNGHAQITTHVRREPPIEQMHDPNDGWDIAELLNIWQCEFHAEWPIEQNWRGFPGWLLRKIGAWISFDEKNDCQVCLLPQFLMVFPYLLLLCKLFLVYSFLV